MKVIGIVGTRSRESIRDFLACKEKFFEIYEDGDRIVSGGCPQGGNKFAEAIPLIENFLNAIPDDVNALNMLAACYRNISDSAADSGQRVMARTAARNIQKNIIRLSLTQDMIALYQTLLADNMRLPSPQEG